MRGRRLPAVAIALAACAPTRRSTRPVAAPTVVVPIAAAVTAPMVTTVDARVTAVLAAHGAPQRGGALEVVAGPVDVREPGVVALRAAAVIRDGDRVNVVLSPVPFTAGSEAMGTVMFDGAREGDVADLLVRDVDRDGHDDLVVLLRRERFVGEGVPLGAYAQVFALDLAFGRALSGLLRAELLLLGVRDAAALDAALPHLTRYEPPADGVAPARLVARLEYATPDELRRVVAPSGLRLCDDAVVRGRPVPRCATHAAGRLTDAMITDRIRRRYLGFAELEHTDFRGLGWPTCRRVAAGVECSATDSAQVAGASWLLVGEGAAMRVAAMSAFVERP